MSRKHRIVLGLLVNVSGLLGLAANTASAQQPCYGDPSCAQSFHYDVYRNNRWPLPFRAQDTRAITSIFEVQKNNGWKLNNTLGVSMFDPATQGLTLSGRSHLQWIVTRAPQDRRVVFVLQGHNQQETAQRVEATQLAISEMIPVGPLPMIYLTDRDSPGSSGIYQAAVVSGLNGSIPAPRLAAGQQTQ